MPYARLEQDVDLGEEAELRRLRLERALVGSDAIAPQAAGSCAAAQQQASASPPAASEDPAVESAAVGAHAVLVTGYAEHLASLVDQKRSRRAKKIDLKLPALELKAVWDL